MPDLRVGVEAGIEEGLGQARGALLVVAPRVRARALDDGGRVGGGVGDLLPEKAEMGVHEARELAIRRLRVSAESAGDH